MIDNEIETRLIHLTSDALNEHTSSSLHVQIVFKNTCFCFPFQYGIVMHLYITLQN